MTTYPDLAQRQESSPPPAPPSATVVTLWVLRVSSTVVAAMYVAQPIFAGRFLDGDFPALATHATNGLLLMGVAWLLVVAALLVWRPGRLGPLPFLLALAQALILPTQYGMGYARFLAVHLVLGVALVGAGVALALWAWRPGRARRSYRPPRPAPQMPVMPDGGAHR